MRDGLSSIMIPELPSSQPPVPDLKKFQMPPVHPSNNCNGNDKAISLDITEVSDSLEITICTFLEFELKGELSAEGLFDDFEGSITLELNTDYVLKGALSTGVKIKVSLSKAPVIELDPILTQLYLQSELAGLASLGLISATLSGNYAHLIILTATVSAALSHKMMPHHAHQCKKGMLS